LSSKVTEGDDVGDVITAAAPAGTLSLGSRVI